MPFKSVPFKPYVFALALVLGVAPGGRALSLADTLQTARTRPAVAAAQLARRDAQAERARTDADPFALALERAEARQRVALSEAQAQAALYGALDTVGGAYTERLQAELEVRAARANEALSRRLVEVARIRFARGSFTALEVREAEAALSVAEAQRRAAEETLTLTTAALRALLPPELGAELVPGALEPISAWSVERPLPAVEVLLRAARETVPALEARQALTLARLSRNLLDPSYSSAREVQAAEVALEAAASTFAETTRTLDAAVRSLYAQTGAAQALYRAQGTTAAAARSRLAFQQRRFARGLVSDLELRQTEYAATAARLEVMRAKHLFVTTLFELQALSGTRLWVVQEATGV